MVRKISALIIVTAGLLCILFSCWNIWESRHSQVSALKQAKAMAKDIDVPNKNIVHFDEDIIGILSVPRLKAELPIVEGTNDEQLKKGVGHYKSSALPKSNDQIVLSGHRDTVFRRFGELQKGDQLILSMKNKNYIYIIDHTKIVDAGDRTIIHSTKPNEELVLTTCYPFHYVGNAPRRYIIYAYPKTK